MFAYCGNNPINRVDSTGRVWEELEQIIRDAATNSANYFSAALGISQMDSPAIGIADLVAAGILIAGVVAFSYNTIQGISESSIFSSDILDSDVESDITSIAQSFGTFQCREAADSIAEYLRKNNQSAELITITFVGGRGYIWSDIKGKTISENGVHIGVLYNGIVYCNVHPFGLPEIVWTEDFHGTGNKIVTKVPI